LEYYFVQLDIMISTSPTFRKNMLLWYSRNICFILTMEAAVYSEKIVFSILHSVIFRKSAIFAVIAVRISNIAAYHLFPKCFKQKFFCKRRL
jgi:hypothetical protein